MKMPVWWNWDVVWRAWAVFWMIFVLVILAVAVAEPASFDPVSITVGVIVAAAPWLVRWIHHGFARPR